MRPVAPIIATSVVAVAAWGFMLLVAITGIDVGRSWEALTTCAAGTATAAVTILVAMPPVVTAWRAGYRAAVRDLSRDPGLDGLTLPDEWR